MSRRRISFASGAPAKAGMSLRDKWQTLRSILLVGDSDARGQAAVVWQMLEAGGGPVDEKTLIRRVTRGPWPLPSADQPPLRRKWNLMGSTLAYTDLAQPALIALWEALDKHPDEQPFEISDFMAEYARHGPSGRGAPS